MIYLQHFLQTIWIITFTLVNSLQRLAYFKSWQSLLQYFAILHFVLHHEITIIPFTLEYSLRMFAILHVLAISLAVLCNFAFVLHHAITLHNASFNFKALHCLAYFEKFKDSHSCARVLQYFKLLATVIAIIRKFTY